MILDAAVGSGVDGTTPLMGHADGAVDARLRDLDGRPVSWFTVAGGARHGALGERGAAVVERAVRLGVARGVPIVGVLDSSGADVTDGVASLHGWGRVARALCRASGVVPTVLGVRGTCLSGPSLLLGLVDAVVMTRDALVYVSGPPAVAAFTGEVVTREALGAGGVHAARTGLATVLVDDGPEIEPAIADLLAYFPSNGLDEPPVFAAEDRDRDCVVAASTVPDAETRAYDVRTVIADVVDADSMLELAPDHAGNIVTALTRVEGRPVGVVANQPRSRAGTLDIDASRKAARFVAWCDAFDLPILTFVDTSGYEPGRTLEWRGMIRHGAQLVHTYARAMVPRVSVILRKAYGGAYIAMDSRTIGNDVCLAWPSAQIAVMGAPGAVAILGTKGLTADGYACRFLNPWRAAERGYVDDVIDPRDTRRAVATAFASLRTKQGDLPRRKHSNIPL
jgi:acetyl-CoA carboxylase carboxyltransferase component